MDDASHGCRRVTGHTVGFICNEDHSVFAEVADRLREAGATVRFFEPGRQLGDAELGGLSLLLNKKVDPASFAALARADEHGVTTWNGLHTLQLGFRLVGYRMLELIGCRVPRVFLEPPEFDYVAKTFVDWHFQPDPVLNGTGDLYQELVPTTGIDHKYYAVDTGDDIAVRVLKTSSKLRGEKRPLERTDPDPELAAAVRRLLETTNSQGIGVDFVESDGTFWAVDVNPAMSFRHAGMEGELADSVCSLLATVEEDARVPT